jgi:hypothetical protein
VAAAHRDRLAAAAQDHAEAVVADALDPVEADDRGAVDAREARRQAGLPLLERRGDKRRLPSSSASSV